MSRVTHGKGMYPSGRDSTLSSWGSRGAGLMRTLFLEQVDSEKASRTPDPSRTRSSLHDTFQALRKQYLLANDLVNYLKGRVRIFKSRRVLYT